MGYKLDNKAPHNPELSPRALDKLHKRLAEYNIKYQTQIAAAQLKKTS